jgi:hypothetical protein
MGTLLPDLLLRHRSGNGVGKVDMKMASKDIAFYSRLDPLVAGTRRSQREPAHQAGKPVRRANSALLHASLVIVDRQHLLIGTVLIIPETCASKKCRLTPVAAKEGTHALAANLK